MKANHRIYSLIILILTASLMSGCGLIKGYGKVRLSLEQGYDMTIQELQDGFLWLAKTIYSDEVTKERRRKFRRMLRTSPNFGRKRHSGAEGEDDAD